MAILFRQERHDFCDSFLFGDLDIDSSFGPGGHIAMEPFARLGKRPRFRPNPGSGRSRWRGKRQAKVSDRAVRVNVNQIVANAGISLNMRPFYRQRG